MAGREGELKQSDMFPETVQHNQQSPPERTRRRRRKPTTFTQAARLVEARRDPIYQEPGEVETLDGKRVTVRELDDDRPVSAIPAKVRPVPKEVPESVAKLANIIQTGKLGGKSKTEIPTTRHTHRRVNRHIPGTTIRITGLAYDATRPQLGETVDPENLQKMADLAHSVLKKKSK